MARRFEGRVAIVTGAGSGIGRATARALGREGAQVTVSDVSLEKAEATAKEIVAEGGSAVAAATNVARDEDCRRTVADTVARWGSLDVLVNNAGIGATGTVLETDEETWDRLM